MADFTTNAQIHESALMKKIFLILLIVPIFTFSQKKDYKTYDKVGSLSKTITPGINLSFASTIDYAEEKLIWDTLDRSNGKNNGTTNAYTRIEASK